MKKCKLCNKKEGKILICNLCASTISSYNIQKNHPEFYREEIVSLFEDRFIPQLNYIEAEIDRLRRELRIKKEEKR